MKLSGKKTQEKDVQEKGAGLTPQQLLFIGELIKQGFQRAGPAYMIAYPKSKKSSSDSNASHLLKNHKVRARIEAEMNDMLAEKKAFLEHEIFNFWYVRMSYDPTEIIGLDGRVKLNDAELRRRGLHVCIESIKKKLNSQGDEYIEIELADRNAAAVRLDGYIHMTKPQPNLNLNLNKDVEQLTPEEEELYQANIRTAFPKLGEPEGKE